MATGVTGNGGGATEAGRGVATGGGVAPGWGLAVPSGIELLLSIVFKAYFTHGTGASGSCSRPIIIRIRLVLWKKPPP